MPTNNLPFIANYGLSTTGNLTANNLTAGNAISTSGNVRANAITIGGATGNVYSTTNANGVTFQGNVTMGNLQVLGTTTTVNQE